MTAYANVEIIFLRSMSLAVAVSGMVLANAEEAWSPSALTPAVAIATYFFVDRWKRFRLSVPGANILGLVAFVAMSVEFYGNDLVGKLLSGAHLLVYMTWVVLLLQKGIRQFWWLLALSTLQISVASVLTTNPGFGALLVLALLAMIWTLSLFTLYRAQLRLHGAGEFFEDSLKSVDEITTPSHIVEVRNGLQLDADEPWVGRRFCGIVGFAFVASLFIGVIVFVVFPRLWVRQSPLAGMPSIQGAMVHQTGFTETVQLGEIGQIMQSDKRVLQLKVTRMEDGSPVSPDEFARAMKMDEILFRGNALGRYYRGRWTSGSNQGTTVGDIVDRNDFDPAPKHSDYRIRISQDPPIATFAFAAPMPATNAIHREGHGHIKQRELSYSLVHGRLSDKLRQEPLTYEIWCAAPPRWQNYHTPGRYRQAAFPVAPVAKTARLMTRTEAKEARYAREWCITRELSTTLPELQRLAISICAEDGQLVSARQCIQRIMKYLNTPGGFQYSLTASVQDPDIDPIEDFLFNRKAGHCEYFASAGALMLQAVNVPASCQRIQRM